MMKKLKRKFHLKLMQKVFLFGCFSFVMTPLALAHPPQRIDMNVMNKAVTAVIYHSSRNPAEHYTFKAILTVNGKEIVVQNFFAQEEGRTKAIYYIPSMKKGDKVVLKASCNKGGDLKEEVVGE